MNYIQKLQAENSELRASAKGCMEQINLFRVHLLSSKFHNDPTIQTGDVLRWLETIAADVRVEG